MLMVELLLWWSLPMQLLHGHHLLLHRLLSKARHLLLRLGLLAHQVCLVHLLGHVLLQLRLGLLLRDNDGVRLCPRHPHCMLVHLWLLRRNCCYAGRLSCSPHMLLRLYGRRGGFCCTWGAPHNIIT